jgi:hypothetical protein
MKVNIKKLLLKCLKQNVQFVLTHEGFTNNCNLTDEEIGIVHKLADEMKISDLVICFDDVALTPYITSYNGSYLLAGIKFNKIETWNT